MYSDKLKDKVKDLNAEEGAPLHVWVLDGGQYHFRELDGITSQNCHQYARSNCNWCHSKGYRIYNQGQMIWRQACECVRKNILKQNDI